MDTSKPQKTLDFLRFVDSRHLVYTQAGRGSIPLAPIGHWTTESKVSSAGVHRVAIEKDDADDPIVKLENGKWAIATFGGPSPKQVKMALSKPRPW